MNQENQQNPAPEEDELAERLKYPDKKAVAKSGAMGALIGLAVIVPGISGSAIAIIFRLYDKLIFAAGHFFRRFRQCLRFLLPIAIGLAAGLILGLFSVQKLIDLQPFAVIALFAGLMTGALPALTDPIRGVRPNAKQCGLSAAGLLFPILLSVASVFLSAEARSFDDLRVYHFLLFLLLGYAVAITQLVPGLSASVLLMICGYFKPFLDSFSLTYWSSNPIIFLVYACFAVGFVAGLLTFSKLLDRILQRHRNSFSFTVVGLSVGSVLTMFFNPDILPVYRGWSGSSAMALELCLGIALFAVGAALSYLLVRFERKKHGTA